MKFICFLGYNHCRETKPCLRGCISLNAHLHVTITLLLLMDFAEVELVKCCSVFARSQRLERQQEVQSQNTDFT